ncbi:hypothetical protein E4U13_004318 [Claviceps humidiphila]|uniref:GST N-terminal domain-containing protein n=1 Tax=Claviceps humidiphila TaxID=1294629 RepID=A0A9P7TT58_9HYPO|nr:hypothetical protein E4U13_004318 [Claviceps humidiphila]
MSDTAEIEKTKTDIVLYLAAGSPQGNSIIGELNSQCVEHEIRYIDLTKNENREPWFLEISPIGIIPALTETVNGEDIAVFGTAAILRYLLNEFKRRNPLPPSVTSDAIWKLRTPLSVTDHWEAVNWMCWMIHRPGVIQALAYALKGHVPDSMPSGASAADFFKDQMIELYGVYNEFLIDNESCCIVNHDATIADVAALEWLSCHALIGLSFEDFPAVKNWYGEARDDLVPFALDCTRVPSPGTLVLF